MGSGKGPGLLPVDFNGDGKTDLISQWNDGGLLRFVTYRSNGDGTFTAGDHHTGRGFDAMGSGNGPGLLPVDFNGDGKTDLISQWNDGGLLRFVTYRSNGDGTFTAGDHHTGRGFDAMGSGKGPGLLPVDFNGDGKTDLISQWNDGGLLRFVTYRSNGDGTFTAGDHHTGRGFDAMGSGNGPGLLPVDFNGDGLTDLISQWNDGGLLRFVTYRSNGNGTFTAVDHHTGRGFDAMGSGKGPGLLPVDFNGDGKTDLISQWNNGGLLTLVTYRSNGDGTFTAGDHPTGRGFDAMGSGNGPGLLPVDFNGDGLTDLTSQWNDGGLLRFVTYRSNGAGTFTAGDHHTGRGFDAMGSGKGPGLLPVDFNGDGLTDLISQWNNGGLLHFVGYVADPPFLSDLLTSITTGIGANVIVTYKSLTSSIVYTKDSTATYPLVDLQGPIYVVSRTDGSNGIGGTSSDTYAYAGAKANLNGRGFLGFRQVTTTDLDTNVTQITTYRQDFPFTGMVATETKKVGAQVLNQITNTYGSAALGGTRQRVFLTQSQVQGFDLDGSVLPVTTISYQYDTFANTTSITVSANDGFSKTTTNTYSNDTTNWLLGRLTNASVMSQTPP